MQAVQFLDDNHLFVQRRTTWSIYAWPTLAEVSHGPGRPLWAQLDGTVMRDGDALIIDGRRFPLRLPGEEPITDVVYRPGRDVLVVAGQSAIPPGGTAPGPSLLPVPAAGITAQPFGTYPADGPSLWTVSLDGRHYRKVGATTGVETIRHPRYLNRSQIVYAWRHTPVYGADSAARLRVADLTTHTTCDLAPELPGSIIGFSAPAASGYFAFLRSERTVYPPWYQLVVVTPNATCHYPLPATIRLTGDPPVWSNDGRWAAVTAFDGIQVGVIRIAVAHETGKAWRYEWCKPSDGGSLRTPALHVDGSVVAVKTHPSGSDVLEVFGPETRTPGLKGVPTIIVKHPSSSDGAPAETVDWRRVAWSHGPHRLEGIVACPTRSERPLPLVVDLHGGPWNGLRWGPHPRLGEWCRRGYAAFAPDWRASGILGFSEMMGTFSGDGEALNDCWRDVETGIDALLGQGVADPANLVLFGHSAGAALVNQCLIRTERFRAAVAWEGHADAALAYYLNWGGGGLSFLRDHLGGSPTQVPDRYRIQSAAAFADRVTTPLLILAGDHAVADPIQWYTLLREQGVACELIVYRGEGHVMTRAENARDVLERSATWFNRWITGAE